MRHELYVGKWMRHGSKSLRLFIMHIHKKDALKNPVSARPTGGEGSSSEEINTEITLNTRA